MWSGGNKKKKAVVFRRYPMWPVSAAIVSAPVSIPNLYLPKAKRTQKLHYGALKCSFGHSRPRLRVSALKDQLPDSATTPEGLEILFLFFLLSPVRLLYCICLLSFKILMLQMKVESFLHLIIKGVAAGDLITGGCLLFLMFSLLPCPILYLGIILGQFLFIILCF